MKLRLQQCAMLFIFIAISLLISGNASPLQAENSVGCDEVKVYLIQGSGQSNLRSDEMNALYDELSDRTNGVNFERLSYPYEYPAVLINPFAENGNLDTAVIGIESIVAEGGWGVYSDSVQQGVLSLQERVNNFISQCNDSDIVLAGYSQGADVIGRLVEMLNEEVRKRILYVALLGDPHANMSPNSGLNPFDVPWRRGTSPLWSDGILGPRQPYTSDSLKYKTGSWCDYWDGICKGNIFSLMTDAHGKYGEKYADAVADEITAAIKKAHPDLVEVNNFCSPSRQDIVLAINTSPSMRTDNTFLSNEGISKIVKDTYGSACDVQVGMVEFGRVGVDPVRPVLDLTSDSAALRETLKTYRDGFEPSTVIEKADVTGGISAAMDFTWREGAKKAIYVISDSAGDTYGLDPRLYHVTYLEQPEVIDLVARSRAQGGVSVFAVNMQHDMAQQFTYAPDASNFYGQIGPLVRATGGYFSDRMYCNYCTWLNSRLDFSTQLKESPNMLVAPVRVKAGESVEIAVRDVYGFTKDSPDWQHRWFVDCRNTTRGDNDQSTITFRADTPGSCVAAVETWRMIAYCYSGCYEEGVVRRGITTFPIEVLPADYTPPPLPGPVRGITKEYLRADKILRVSWEAPENAGEVGELAYIIKDGDGNIVGVTTATKLHITDVQAHDIPIVTVNVASANGVGEDVSTVDAEDQTQPEAQPDQPPRQVLSSDDVRQMRSLESGVTPISPVRVAVSGGSVQGSSIVDNQMSAAGETEIILPTSTAVTKQLPSVESKADHPAWLKLTIVAVPLSLLTALGIAVKHGVLLKLKR